MKKRTTIDLKSVFLGLQDEMVAKLRSTRRNIRHPTSKGNVTESSWRAMLEKYLPERYEVATAFVIDSECNISEQIDLVIFDRHFSPFLFHEDGACYIPAESVYAVFEIKQEATVENILYAAKKAESVRKLKRTSVAITHAGGKFPPAAPKEIFAGFLALTTSGKEQAISNNLLEKLSSLTAERKLNLVCVLERGAVDVGAGGPGETRLVTYPAEQSLISFFLSLLSKLQALGSVTAMDISAYANSLKS